MTLKEIEIILNKLVNDYEYGYAYIKNSRDLLEKLTEYNQKIKVSVG